MSTKDRARQTHYHLLLLHATEPLILLLPEEDGWCLPSFYKEEPTHLSEISAAIQRQLNLDTIVLYCASQQDERENVGQKIMYVLEIRSPSWVPTAGTQWVGFDTLMRVQLTHPEQRTIIATCLQEDIEVPPLRPAWARRGWFAEAERWIKEQLGSLNYTMNAPIEQVRTWGLSCVLRVPVTDGSIYFKASLTSFGQKNTSVTSTETMGLLPLLFTHEPMVIQSLAVWYPQNVPTVLAMERERCWMLLAEFGTLLYAMPDHAMWEKALIVFGQMQVAASQHIDTLLDAGCLDRRLNIVEDQIDPLCNDEEVLADLTTSEVEQLRAQGQYLKASCRQLAHDVIPQTLVHGDLHMGNIAVQHDNAIYFDWTDCCIAHPFFDALTFLNDVDDPVERKHLRETYLAQWTDYASIEHLQEVFPLLQMLATIHQAVSYRHIMANVEGNSKPTMRGGVTYWLRKLLQLLADPIG